MSNYFRKCSSDIQIWTYDKIKNILCLPYLPKEAIQEEFLKIQDKILSTLKEHLTPRELESFMKMLNTLNKIYFGNELKIDRFCKYEKTIRTSNNMEGYHSAMNKSSLFKKNSTLSTTVNGRKKNTIKSK